MRSFDRSVCWVFSKSGPGCPRGEAEVRRSDLSQHQHTERSNDSHHGVDRHQGGGRAGAQEQRIPFARMDAQAGERAGAALARHAVDVVKGDLDDEATLRRALAGAWGVFGVQNTWEAGVEREEAQGKRLATLAREAGVEHYVYTSVGSAHKRTGVPHFDNKWRIEETVRGLHFPSHVILRPVAFHGKPAGPLQSPGRHADLGARASHEAADDCCGRTSAGWRARVHRGRRLEPREMISLVTCRTMPEAAEILTKALGRPIAFAQTPIAQVRQYSEDTALMLEWFERVGYSATSPAWNASSAARSRSSPTGRAGRDSSARSPTTRRSPPPCAPWSAPARARDQESKHAHRYDALMESVSPRGDVTFEADTSAAYRDCGYNRRVGGQAKRSSTARWLVQLWLRQGVPHLVGQIAARAGARAFIPDYRLAPNIHFGCHGRRAGMLPRTCRAGRAPDCAQPETPREAIWPSDSRRALPAQPASSNATLVELPVVSPVTDLTLSGASYEMRADADPLFYSSAGRGNSCIPNLGAPTRDNHWLRPFTVDTPACLPPAFTSVTTKCCWTTRSDMWSVRLPQASMPELMCGWGCHMGFPQHRKIEGGSTGAGCHRCGSSPRGYADRRMTLRIETASDGETALLRLSGQIDEDHLVQLQAEIRRYRPRLVCDLTEATLVDRAVVQFLAAREGEGVELLNCPRYIREWITKERDL